VTHDRLYKALLFALAGELLSRMEYAGDPYLAAGGGGSEEPQRLQALWLALDENADDAVSAEDVLRYAGALGLALSASEAAQLHAALDVDGNGWIGRQEFVAALTDWGRMQREAGEAGGLWATLTARTFAALDADADGALGQADVAAALRASGPATAREFQAAARVVSAHAKPDRAPVDDDDAPAKGLTLGDFRALLANPHEVAILATGTEAPLFPPPDKPRPQTTKGPA